MRNWRPGELELAKTLYFEHVVRPFPRTLDDLAEEYAMSRYRVHRLVMDYRMEMGEVVMTKPVLRKLYVKDMLSTREIADRFLCDKRTVLRHLKKNGIKVRPPGNPRLMRQAAGQPKIIRYYAPL